MLDPLIAGLKQRGLCFATIVEHPQFRQDHRSAVREDSAPRAAGLR
jgi:hypothetical protein